MLRRSYKSAVWNISSSGTPYFFKAAWNLKGRRDMLDNKTGQLDSAECIKRTIKDAKMFGDAIKKVSLSFVALIQSLNVRGETLHARHQHPK